MGQLDIRDNVNEESEQAQEIAAATLVQSAWRGKVARSRVGNMEDAKRMAAARDRGGQAIGEECCRFLPPPRRPVLLLLIHLIQPLLALDLC